MRRRHHRPPTDQKHIELRGIASIRDLHARAQDQTSGLESELDAGEEEPVPARKHPARSIAGGALLVAVATAWERPHTCFDVFTPDSPFGRSASAASLSNCNPREVQKWTVVVVSRAVRGSELAGLRLVQESKVVVSVTVEGSVGPVKAMVRLGASVGEAIAAVVERYAKEGRSPRLDPAAAEAFQLHHSHFCLQSLNKNDKIGDVGGRNFYLHKNDGNNRIYLQSEESGTNLVGGEIAHSFGGQQIVAINHDQFFAIFIKKLDKIGRLTKRIWRLLTCNCT